MNSPPSSTVTAFAAGTIAESGSIREVAAAARRRLDQERTAQLLVFDDSTGRIVDLDLRGSPEEVAARYEPGQAPPAVRGRPRLGVVAREVTLLPRHWEWLGRQAGGASAALRRLVEEASRAGDDRADGRARQEAGYRFLAAVAGDLPGFEEACRAFFAGDREGFRRRAAKWPADILSYAERLTWADRTVSG